MKTYASKLMRTRGSFAPARSPSLLRQRPFEPTTRAETPAQLGYSFNNLRTLAEPDTTAVHLNSAQEDEEAGEAVISELPGEGMPKKKPAGGEDELGGGAVPMDEPGKAAVKCPTKTVVEKTTDMTPKGIEKGYRTGYGAVATMRVEPDATNWDGTQIVEANKRTKNTCPEEFKIDPCSGKDTFTVGAERNSSVLGKLPATKNRFYDFHTSRWNIGSLLHERNPKNIDSCEAVCEQNYSCGGKVIGTHTVTRTFTKGKSGDRDVTLVNVKKT